MGKIQTNTFTIVALFVCLAIETFAHTSNLKHSNIGLIEVNDFPKSLSQNNGQVILKLKKYNNRLLAEWTLASSHSYETYAIEESYDRLEFFAVHEDYFFDNDRTDYEQEFTPIYNKDILYFRLKLIGSDGRIIYSPTIVYQKNNNNQFRDRLDIFPNPITANTISMISYSGAIESISLINNNWLFERFIEVKELPAEEIKINLDNYDPGTYLIIVQTEYNLYIKKVIIQ